jgi:GTP-binding protein
MTQYFTQFLLSAMAASQFPASEVPEIAFLGRSNVGKSSLINALLGEKAAKVSSTPGRTRAINFFALKSTPTSLHPHFLFADLPGYGFAKLSRSISAEWPSFIEPYLTDRPQLALCVCLVDANIPPQPSDRQLQDWLRAAGRRFVVLGTKADKLSGNGRSKATAALRKGHALDEVLLCSSKTGAGIKELWGAIEAAVLAAADENGS